MERKSRVVQIWVDTQCVSGYPDLKGFTEPQLQEEFGITEREAEQLWWVLHDEDQDKSTYRLPKEQAGKFLEMIQESIHQGLPGHNDTERFIIYRFLADIVYGLSIE